MQKVKDIHETINRVYDAMFRISTIYEPYVPQGTPYMDIWEWPQGVALYAMYLYYKDTNEKKYYYKIIDWFEMHIKKGLPRKNVNTVCPMLTLAHIYEESGDERYLNICLEWLDYVMNEMPRTVENGIQHITTEDTNNQQLWDDTLYMTVLFVAKMGEILKDDRYTQESIDQFLVHIKYLTDTKTGLFFHGWTFDGNHNFAKALWARGNSWYTAGLVDYLNIVKVNDGVKRFLISTLNRQVESLSHLQTENGLWRTLLDDETSYEEASATAAFGYGILKAVRLGYIDKKYEDIGIKAVKGILNCVDDDGVVNKVSYGTGMGDTLDHYRNIPICPELYGQSMVLLLLVEALKH